MADKFPISDRKIVISEENRTTVIFSNLKESSEPIELVWDSLDQALYLKDVNNKTSHRIYPSLVEGAPTVAGQIVSLKEGYKPSEIPKGNEITVSVYDLETLLVEFTNKVYLSSFRGSLISDILSGKVTEISRDGVTNISITVIPKGNILSGTLISSGSGYTTSNLELRSDSGLGDSCQVSIETTETTAISGSIVSRGSGFNGFSGTFTGSSLSGSANGTGILFELQQEGGSLLSATIISGGSGYQVGEVLVIDRGNMYSDPATFIIDSVDGGVISSLTINDGGRLFTSGEIITIPGGDGRAQFQVDSVQQSGPEASYDILATRAYAEEEKTNSVYFSLDRTLEYSTSHAIAISDVYNMAWESTSHTSTVTTIAAPEPCPPITSILFEAWGSGQQELSPQTEEEWIYKHEDNSFIYYQDGISWEEFISKLNTTIAVPDSVTAPDLVYVWYKEGKYLLGDAAWMVGIIGSETGYDGSSYQYVLYSLDMIGETLQLAPSGTSTYQCGTIEWGGNWGDSIQQFKLNRN